MLITMTIVILSSAIFVMFLDEFRRLFKKISSIPGVKLFLPLLLGSWFILTFEEGGLRFLLWAQGLFHRSIQWMSTLTPFHHGSISMVETIHLVFLALLPITCVVLKGHFQKGHRVAQSTLLTRYLGLVLWIIGVIMLAVPSYETT